MTSKSWLEGGGGQFMKVRAIFERFDWLACESFHIGIITLIFGGGRLRKEFDNRT